MTSLTRTLLLASCAVVLACGGPETGADAGGEDTGTPPPRDSGTDAAPEACPMPGAVETVACGNCGTVERFCTAGGTWAYGVCEGESGECTPGSTRESACGNCGTEAQRCTAACVWESAGACSGEGTCAPGTTTRSGDGCPAGSTREVTCNDACAYEPVSACEEDMCTTPGTIETVPCGNCGTRTRFCSDTGVWAYGTCGDEGVCVPGTTGTGTCGLCGTRTTVCDSTCSWIPFGDCMGEEACCLPSSDSVDLLFMIDNSNSMAEEQASLAAELPRMISALASGDVNGDGTPEFAPIGSLQAGVITSDMGTGGYSIPTCDRGTFGTMFGDDGVLLTRGNTAVAGCTTSYPRVFTFDPSGSPAAFAAELSCVARTGTGGCGFEQQLEAVLKAATPSSATSWTSSSFTPPTFFAGTSGHALGQNAGFMRDGSLLVVVILTDEEDCSALEPELFNPASTTYSGDLNLRCFSHPSALHPISRFVDGLTQLRVDPRRLVVTSIVGIPPSADPTTSVPNYDAILALPEMVERIDPSMPTRLTPSCNTTQGIAFPPRRILSVQRDLEARGVATTTGSICQSSFTAVTNRILTRIAERLAGTCP